MDAMAQWRHKPTGKKVPGAKKMTTAKWEVGENGVLPDGWKDDWEKVEKDDETNEDDTSDDGDEDETEETTETKESAQSPLKRFLFSDVRAVTDLFGSDEEETDE